MLHFGDKQYAAIHLLEQAPAAFARPYFTMYSFNYNSYIHSYNEACYYYHHYHVVVFVSVVIISVVFIQSILFRHDER